MPPEDQTQRVPPPAQLPPGIKGTPPLPVGRAVSHTVVPKRPTPAERQVLESVGWKDGEPIPADMAARIAAAEQDAMADARAAMNAPPVDPSTPPIKLDVKEIGDISAQQQRVVRDAIQEAAVSAATPSPPTSIPDVAQKVMAAEQLPPAEPEAGDQASAAPEPASPQTASPGSEQAGGRDTGFVPDGTNPVRPASPGASAEAAGSVPGDGSQLGRRNCPHCNWDLAVPDPVEPGDDEKAAFLQSMLGAKPFIQERVLMGGRLKVTFRTLSPGEIDVLYQEVYKERDEGKVTNEMDFMERLARLRLYLQLLRVDAATFTGGVTQLPMGLSKDTNPHAQTWWENLDTDRPLLSVEKFMVSQVTPTESMARVIQIECGRFNQLVNKMEVMVDNPSFWQAPAPRP